MLVERVAEPAEHRAAARVDLTGRLLLATDRRQLAQQLLLRGVEPGRGLDDDRDDQVAAATAQPGHAATAEHLLGARLGAGADVELEAGLDLGRRLLVRRRTSASRVGRVSTVPSAAAVIGSVTVQCRSLPWRVKVGVRRDVDLDVQVAGRAAAGADLALAR